MRVKSAKAQKILNSNSNFTIQVRIETPRGVFRGSSPAGESISKYEVKQFGGEVDEVISKFNVLLKEITTRNFKSVEDIYALEKSLPNGFIGGPSLALSYALLHAISNELNVEPFAVFGKKSTVLPICKMLGGGMHASGLGMDMQEILVTTVSNEVKESIRGTLEVYKKLKEILAGKTASFLGGVDPEGGFVTALDNYESLKTVRRAVEKVVENTGLDVRMGVDVAASAFYSKGKYVYKKPLSGKRELSEGEQIDLMVKLNDEFNFAYIEDPVDENSIAGYKEVKEKTDTLVVGDDVTATRTDRLDIAKNSINAVLIKPNQVGALYKVMEFSKMADSLGMTKIVSHRSEETNDSIISDLAMGLSAKYLKVGINRGERVEKINRLIEIDEL